MITLRGLTKRYGDTTAVRDLSLDIAPGRVTGFLGPNGAGKSTTMRMIFGLDPDGVRWIRELARSLAAEGRAVLVSSHLMSEMQLTADQLIVIGRGRLLADAPIAEVLGGGARSRVVVRSPDAGRLRALADALAVERSAVERVSDHELAVRDGSIERVGDLAHRLGVPLHGLEVRTASLEQAYMELTADSVEYGTTAAVPEGRA
ncbi:ATP-binding cassette domain-containing protein [Actinoallomurus spadix]|uniref:ABC transporter domain-containing protein n=1 Tax=Actinoallomurus spadix TaxID=79912 RepID=A0ABN0WDR8_9ACTN|nr:ATP-binding cassette domain-containing protein [Actinoallomurus spadix]MCO5987187.1 ATP-binding cassette domain-containing protein [Actinoallomurus spadix]